MSCPEDTDAKRLTRFFLYRRVKHLWQATGNPGGHALVLAGDEASEIGCLRDYLSLHPDFTHFVDVDAVGLEVVRKQWKKAQTFHGTIENAIDAVQGEIGFLNLDFCGYLNQKVVASIESASHKIAVKGIVSYTFTRDRESATTPNWDRVEEIAKKAMANDPRYRSITKDSPEWMDAVRFVGYSSALKSMLGKSFEVVFMLRYRAESSRNMGVIALQNIPPAQRTPAWRKEMATYRSYEEKIGSILNVDLRSKLRDIAMELTDVMKPTAVADILHLPRSTMAAWQAHKTRGTYAGE